MARPRALRAELTAGAGRLALALALVAAPAAAHAAAAVAATQTLTPAPAPPQPQSGAKVAPAAPVSASGDTTASTPTPAVQPSPESVAARPAPVTAGAPIPTNPVGAASETRLNPTGRDVSLVVPLRERGPLGQVQITISATDAISVSLADLVTALGRVVRPAVLDAVRAAADARGLVPLAAAARAGLPLHYDAEASELVVDIAAGERLTQELSLGLPLVNQQVQPDKSAPFAAFLNYRAGLAYEIDGTQADRLAVVADLQFSGRLFGVAFENFASVDQLAAHTFVRTASRLIYDVPGPALRITAGDLFTETTAFQSDPQIAGVNFSHLVSTFYPSAAVTGRSSRTLTLAQASTVQLYVNGAPLTEVRLGPGTYDIRDFPLAQGANNVQAVVTDDAGERRTLSFSFFSDINLLTPGLDEYTFSAGVLNSIGDDGPNYQGDQPLFSGFYRRGLTEQLTAGANFQASRFNQILGFDGVFGSPYGVFGVNVAGNHLDTGALGGALRLQYRYASRTNTVSYARTVDVSLELRTRRFADANAIDPDNSEEALFAIAFNQPLSRDFSLSLSGNYAKSRLADSDVAGVSAFLTYQAPLETTLGIGVTYEDAPRPTFGQSISGRGFSIAGTLTHRFGARSYLSSQVDRFQQRVDYTRSPLHPTNDYAINAAFQRTDFGYTGTAAAAYETNRGNIEAQYNSAFTPGGAPTSQVASLLWDGSIAYADGQAALGRHITDGFAILQAHPSLGDRQVLVNTRFADDVLAQSGAFGPALAPLTSYQRQVIPYDVKNLPPGYDLGDGAFEVYPWLHSGFKLTVGSAYNISAVGVLLDGEGKPVTLRTGTARSLNDPKAPPVDVITNRDGRFAALGLAPGRWRIEMSGAPPLAYEIDVRQTADALLRFGDVRPAGASAPQGR